MDESYAIRRYEQAAALLPLRWQQQARQLAPGQMALAEELRLRAGRPMTVLLPEGEVVPGPSDLPPTVTQSDLEQLCDAVTDYSRYAAGETLSRGYLTARGGFRVGVCGTAVLRDGINTNLRDLSSVTIYIINFVYRLTVFQPVDNFLYVCSLQRITFNIHIDHAGLYFFKCTPRSVKRNQRNIASRPGRLSGRTNCLDCTKRHIIILRYNHINIFIFLQIFFHHFSAFCRGKISIIGIQNFPVRMRPSSLCKRPFRAALFVTNAHCDFLRLSSFIHTSKFCKIFFFQDVFLRKSASLCVTGLLTCCPYPIFYGCSQPLQFFRNKRLLLSHRQFASGVPVILIPLLSGFVPTTMLPASR